MNTVIVYIIAIFAIAICLVCVYGLFLGILAIISTLVDKDLDKGSYPPQLHDVGIW